MDQTGQKLTKIGPKVDQNQAKLDRNWIGPKLDALDTVEHCQRMLCEMKYLLKTCTFMWGHNMLQNMHFTN